MGLSGDLRTMDLAEVLQWAERGRLTGTLHLDRHAIRKWLIFRDGIIVSSGSSDPGEHLGQHLVRDGLITEEQLFSALLRQEDEGTLLGGILVGDGLLSEADLRTVLTRKAEESIFELFLWPDGRFEFREGELPDAIPVETSLDVTGVILEGARRVDEWRRICKVVPSSRSTFSPTSTAVTEPLERTVVDLARGGKSMAAIALELRRSQFHTAELLAGLVRRGVLTVNAAPGGGLPQDTVGLVSKLLEQAREALGEERYTDATNAFRTVLLMDRLNLHAKKGLVAVAQARGNAGRRAAVSLDAVPRLAAELSKLTGERFDPLEGFILSRVNGRWSVRAILKLCPVPERDALRAFAQLVERGVLTLHGPHPALKAAGD